MYFQKQFIEACFSTVLTCTPPKLVPKATSHLLPPPNLWPNISSLQHSSVFLNGDKAEVSSICHFHLSLSLSLFSLFLSSSPVFHFSPCFCCSKPLRGCCRFSFPPPCMLAAACANKFQQSSTRRRAADRTHSYSGPTDIGCVSHCTQRVSSLLSLF